MAWFRRKKPPPEPEYGVRRLLLAILQSALAKGADKVLFGRPPGIAEANPDPSHAELAREPEELSGVGIYPEPIFSRLPGGQVPVYMRLNGRWEQTDSFPWRILVDLVQNLEYLLRLDTENNPKTKRRELLIDGKRVYAELWLEANYCWSLEIVDVSTGV